MVVGLVTFLHLGLRPAHGVPPPPRHITTPAGGFTSARGPSSASHLLLPLRPSKCFGTRSSYSSSSSSCCCLCFVCCCSWRLDSVFADATPRPQGPSAGRGGASSASPSLRSAPWRTGAGGDIASRTRSHDAPSKGGKGGSHWLAERIFWQRMAGTTSERANF